MNVGLSNFGLSTQQNILLIEDIHAWMARLASWKPYVPRGGSILWKHCLMKL